MPIDVDQLIDPGPPVELALADFAFVRALLRERAAIVLEDDKEYLVLSRLRPVARAAGLDSVRDLVRALRADPGGPLAEEVIDAMTTNETSFFRDIHPFEALVTEVIPELLAGRRGRSNGGAHGGAHGGANDLSVWSGACSSGQEPYSLAITILERLPELDPARLRIVATDLSPTMVRRCREGRFTQLEINRGMPARLLVKYFEQDGTTWVARPEVRQLVEVHEMNLTGAWHVVPRCDVVLLRNVLIYFSPETRKEILQRVRTRVLEPGGYLILGAGETTLNLDPAYERRTVGSAVLHRAPQPTGPRTTEHRTTQEQER